MDKRIAYGLISIKSFDEKSRTFRGIATTATADRMDDIVEPKGAEFRLPLPFLHQHDSSKPVGRITRARVVGDGIEVDGMIEQIDAPPSLKERLDVAWAELKSGLVRGLSIGFNPKEFSHIKETGGIRFTKWEWLELSMVTIAANQEATITTVKQMAALGRSVAPTTQPARAGAQSKGSSMETLQQQVSGLRDSLRTQQLRMKELDDSVEANGFTDEVRKEIGELSTSIADTNARISLKEGQADMATKAQPLPNEARRGVPYGFVKKLNDVEETFKGETGLKRAMAGVIAQMEVKKGNIVTPAQIVEERWGKTNPTLVAVMKAAVAGGGTDSGEWGAELAQADTRYTGDFVDYLYALTTFDRLPLKPVPHNVVIKGQDGAFTGYFTGQSKAIKVSKGDFSSTSTVPYKAAGMTVISNELIRDSSPAALELCGTGLRNAVRQVVDSTFFSFAAISAGVSPAGIFNGLTPITSNGGDAQSIITDVGAIWAPFIAANNLEGNFFWTMGPATAVKLSLMQTALGQTQFPGLSAMGGTFQGYPVYVTQNMHAGDVALMNGSEIWKIGDLGVSVETSNSAMVEQDSAPQGATDTPVAASATMVSMFQEDSTAIRVIRPISWGKKYASAVAVIGSTTWGAEAS